VSRLDDAFAKGKKALVAYLCVGDPSEEESIALALACAEAGADVLELGCPFSDPTADGPAIARASQRALAKGGGLDATLRVARAVRDKSDVPIVLFGYYNPLFRYGVERIATDAAAAGADGFLCVDLPPEEAADLRTAANGAGLDLIALLAPTTPPARIRTVARAASGFLYFVSVLGTTGARSDLPAELPALVERVRGVTTLPVGVGFGVSRAEQAGWIAGFADAVIVGSALARLIEDGAGLGAPGRVATLVGTLRQAMNAASAARAG
jgi:tryptophan synthase alpha chain